MSTRAVVISALGGVILSVVLDGNAESQFGIELRVSVLASLLFAMFSLLRFDWRANSLPKLQEKLDFQFTVSNLHSYNLKLAMELKAQQRRINLREASSIISVAFLCFALFQMLYFGVGSSGV